MTVQQRALELVNKIAAELGIELEEFDAEAIAGRLARDIEANDVDTFNTIVAFDNVARNDFRAKRDELGEGDAEAGEIAISGAMQQVFDDNPELTTPEDPAEPGTPEDLVAALAALQEANAGVADAAEAMNAGLGEEDAPEDYTADADGVAAARADVQADFDADEKARDDFRDTTVIELGAGDLKDGVSKYLGTAQALTEANLTTVEAGVLAEIGADETVLFLDDNGSLATVTEFDLNNATEGKDDTSVDQLLDLTNAATAGNSITVKLAELAEGNKNSNGGGGSDTIILPKFADIDRTVIINNMILGDSDRADSLVAEGLADADELSIEVNTADGENGTQGIFPYINVTVGSAVTFNNLIKSHTFVAQLAKQGLIKVQVDDADGEDVTATVADGIGDFEAEGNYDNYVITEVNGTAPASPIAIEGSAGLFNSVDHTDAEAGPKVETGSGWEGLATDLGAEGFAAYLEASGNLIAEEDVASNLESVGVTLADLQQQMLDAEGALSSARDAKSDFEVLDTVRAEISAYIAAGGNDVDNILTLRNTIRDLPDTEGFDAAEYELDTADVPSRDELLSALAGVASLTDGEAVTEPQAEAPTGAAGQGTWVQGEEVTEGSETYEWTYEPTAEEQALLDALTAVEDREELIAKEEQTETNFTTATVGEADEALGAQLVAIEDRLKLLAEAEQAVLDAQAELDDANALIDALEAALDVQAEAKAWFTDQDLALPVSLNDDRAGTEDGDIFLFVESEDEAFTITGFGEEGVDSIFFGADANFSLVSLAELGEDGQSIEDRVGDNDTLEIFYEETDTGLVLYVEADVAAGFDRDGQATEQMTQITLAGVAAEDIEFDGQTLTAGTVEIA